ncbi:hypothetical protein [Thiocystis violascens]|uniref:hypothetical protein n=1 Tax=Thiocystis violascens TaxID=73141 RepID=UPI0012F68CCF|nr:hypothetical protein [Thiocystis violascens]
MESGDLLPFCRHAPRPQPVDLAFEAFLKELPPEYATMAREFKAFARPRKLKTPAHGTC